MSCVFVYNEVQKKSEWGVSTVLFIGFLNNDSSVVSVLMINFPTIGFHLQYVMSRPRRDKKFSSMLEHTFPPLFSLEFC
jgi:hypothetical protein